MSEVWMRVALVAAALIGAGVLISVRRSSGAGRRLVAPSTLNPGVYLFTSDTCLDCVGARDSMTGALGISGFVEIRWETEPEVFRQLGIEQVPSTVIVSVDGVSTVHPGVPPAVMEAGDP